jgi:hypothetical protein
MNRPIFKENRSPLVGICIGLGLAAAIVFFAVNFLNRDAQPRDNTSPVEAQLRSDIEALKLSVDNLAEAKRQTERSILEIQQNQTTVSLKFREEFLDVRKQLTDSKADVDKQLEDLFLALRLIAPRPQ